MTNRTEYTDTERENLYESLNVGDLIDLTDGGVNREAKVIKKNSVMVIIERTQDVRRNEDPITYFFKHRISWN
jgi:hypothetical protein